MYTLNFIAKYPELVKELFVESPVNRQWCLL